MGRCDNGYWGVGLMGNCINVMWGIGEIGRYMKGNCGVGEMLRCENGIWEECGDWNGVKMGNLLLIIIKEVLVLSVNYHRHS